MPYSYKFSNQVEFPLHANALSISNVPLPVKKFVFAPTASVPSASPPIREPEIPDCSPEEKALDIDEEKLLPLTKLFPRPEVKPPTNPLPQPIAAPDIKPEPKLLPYIAELIPAPTNEPATNEPTPTPKYAKPFAFICPPFIAQFIAPLMNAQINMSSIANNSPLGSRFSAFRRFHDKEEYRRLYSRTPESYHFPSSCHIRSLPLFRQQDLGYCISFVLSLSISTKYIPEGKEEVSIMIVAFEIIEYKLSVRMRNKH